MSNHARCLGLLVALYLASCTHSGADEVAECEMKTPAITQGVFGCITSTNDVGDADTQPLSGFHVQVFKSQARPTADAGLMPQAQTQSGELGYFELALEPGSYWICTAFFRCGMLEVLDAQTVRKDYDFGPGPGW